MNLVGGKMLKNVTTFQGKTPLAHYTEYERGAVCKTFSVTFVVI